jgi:hypothetical protein
MVKINSLRVLWASDVGVEEGRVMMVCLGG